ncbi:protein phosphatase 2C domain-containing protein [Streptomyces sp. NPDC058773]|uniref:protein phosphatase 2C domain-containing protein n=1 Tax=Streptomyces sp. NPDC058773 TaxID=3346632 RepID=UPI003675737C
MNQQGAGSGQEDDWWRQLYGEGGGDDGSGSATVRDAGPSDTPDTLDDRVASALRAVAPPRRTTPYRQPPAPRRTATPPPARPTASPPAPIPLQATGPGSRPSPPAPKADRPTPEPAHGTPAPPAPERPDDWPPLAGPGDPADPASSADPAAPELGTLPAADPAALDDQVPDTTLDGARYGSLTLLAASRRGDVARRRGDVRRDALLTARFGAGRHALILIAVATGRPGATGAHRAAREACARIGGAVGRSYTRLAEDIRTDHRSALKSGLQRLTERSYGRLRDGAPEPDDAPERYPAALRCLLLPADPDCRIRVLFGIGAGGLFRLRDGAWEDLEPAVPDQVATGGPDATPGRLRSASDRQPDDDPDHDPYGTQPFLFRTAFARPGDTLLLCSAGLAEPLQQDSAFAARLAGQWSAAEPPAPTAFLDAAQLRVAGHPKDRTAVGVWES